MSGMQARVQGLAVVFWSLFDNKYYSLQCTHYYRSVSGCECDTSPVRIPHMMWEDKYKMDDTCSSGQILYGFQVVGKWHIRYSLHYQVQTRTTNRRGLQTGEDGLLVKPMSRLTPGRARARIFWFLTVTLVLSWIGKPIWVETCHGWVDPLQVTDNMGRSMKRFWSRWRQTFRRTFSCVGYRWLVMSPQSWKTTCPSRDQESFCFYVD